MLLKGQSKTTETVSEQEKSEDVDFKRVLGRGSSIILINSYIEQDSNGTAGGNQGS